MNSAKTEEEQIKNMLISYEEWIQEEMEEGTYLPGSMVDQVITARRALAAVREKLTINREKERKRVETVNLLHSVTFLINLFREVPSWSDKKFAEVANISPIFVRKLRAIVNEDISKKVERTINETFFSDLPITSLEKEKLEKSIEKFYSKK